MSIFSSRVFFYIHIDIDFLDVVEKVKFIESWIESEYWRVYLLKSVVVITLHYFESVVMMITIHYRWSSLTLKPSIETSGMLWQLSDAFDTRWKLLYHLLPNIEFEHQYSRSIFNIAFDTSSKMSDHLFPIFKVNIQYWIFIAIDILLKLQYHLPSILTLNLNIQDQYSLLNIAFDTRSKLSYHLPPIFKVDIQYCFWNPLKIAVSSTCFQY